MRNDREIPAALVALELMFQEMAADESRCTCTSGECYIHDGMELLSRLRAWFKGPATSGVLVVADRIALPGCHKLPDVSEMVRAIYYQAKLQGLNTPEKIRVTVEVNFLGEGK